MSPHYRPFLAAGILVALLASVDGVLHAQQRIDSRGTEFVIAFMPTNGYEVEPHIAIGISASRPTIGTLTYTRNRSTRAISIPEANRIEWIELDSSELMTSDFQSNKVSSLSIALSFRDPVSVIGANTMRWSGDAFLALPTKALGNDYILLSYPSTAKAQPAGTDDSDFPAEFCVVAAEDGTRVTIVPSTELHGRTEGRFQPFTITLNRGEIYLGMALGDSGVGRDISGTTIQASRPVAVFAGAWRTNIPWYQASGRDHLVEQMIPTANWQTDALVTPFFQLGKTIRDSNIVRIIASSDGETTVMSDGHARAVLRKGEVVEIPLDRAQHITATGPILVAQFHHSTMVDSLQRLPNDSVGDPTMLVAPSPAQFDTAYVFQSLATVNYTRHFINVIVKEGSEGEVELDGVVPGEDFNPIGSSGYSFAQIEVSPGSHAIRSSTPFGLIVYGYGVYTAYGYPGGLVLVRPPASVPEERGLPRIGTMTPNPATGSTTWLPVHLEVRSALHIEIVDAKGAVVGVPVDHRSLPEGEHLVEIDISALPTGVYLLEATIAGRKMSQALVVVR
jgi:hypothetical protein